MISNVEQVKQSIQRLPAGEIKELSDWFAEYKPSFESMRNGDVNEAIFLRRLMKKGLLSEISDPMTDEEDDEYEAMEIEGEPLSEMILRERR